MFSYFNRTDLLGSTTIAKISIAPIKAQNNVSSGGKPNKGAIAGGVGGGVLGLALIGGGFFWFLRRRRRQQERAIFERRAEPNLEISDSAASRWNAIAPSHKYFAHYKGALPAAEIPKLQPNSAMLVSGPGLGTHGSGSGGGTALTLTDPSALSSTATQTMLARQVLMNDELRGEVDNLRRDMERIREERGSTFIQDLPPQYSDPQ